MVLVEHTILETDNFIIVTVKNPHIDRQDGGHIVIMCKEQECKNFTDLPEGAAMELTRLAMQCGLAMKEVLNRHGIDVELINYQMNGNWSVNMKERDPVHMHLYGRARSSRYQKFGEALYLPNPDTGFYKDFTGLTKEDIECIRVEMLSRRCETEKDVMAQESNHGL